MLFSDPRKIKKQKISPTATGHGRRRASANMVLPQWGVKSFDETFVRKQTAVHLLNFCAKNPPLRQYPNRYQQGD